METVDIRKLSTVSMVAGGEKKHSVVLHNGMLKRWVGFGWVTEGRATAEDRRTYPTVVPHSRRKQAKGGKHE